MLAGAGLSQEFEVVSVKPNKSGANSSSTTSDPGRLTATNVSLRSLIAMAYGLKNYQLEGPDWLADVKFDIAAKFPEALPNNREEYNKALHSMMEKLLVERFKVAVHRSTKNFSVYVLVVDKRGIKFKEVPDSDSHNQNSNNTHYQGRCVPMSSFADFLARRVDLPVLDMTGLKGFYDLALDWVPESRAPEDSKSDVTAANVSAGTSLPVALQEQLGLKLEMRKAPIEMLIVDHVEKVPTEN